MKDGNVLLDMTLVKTFIIELKTGIMDISCRCDVVQKHNVRFEHFPRASNYYSCLLLTCIYNLFLHH